MTEPFYVSRASVEKIDGVHRRASLEDGTRVDFGVHGPVKAHYGLDSQPNLPLPVDYLVAAAAGWLLGTLNGALEVRGIPMAADAIRCTAEGTNEMIDRIVVLTKIHVHYTVRVPADADREKVDRALETHVAKCPTAKSLEGAVSVTWTADVRFGE